MKKIKIWVAAILVGCSLMALAAGCKSPEEKFVDDLKHQLQNELKDLQ